MTTIKIPTSDVIIWDKPRIYADIVVAMTNRVDIVLDFLCEGPDINMLGIYDFLYSMSEQLNYDLSKIKITVGNAAETHGIINIEYISPMHLLHNAKDYVIDIKKQMYLKHFGIFIGRSNAPRLFLASYINEKYNEKSICTYHFNKNDDFHRYNVGLDDLIQTYNITDLTSVSAFLQKCPIMLQQTNTVIIDKSLSSNPAQQLLEADKNVFSLNYRDFFVEIVCETYYSGNTFFTTEKIFRPMLLKTPFIVQGPTNFLKNLKKLGFRTFDHWWDEGYDQDPTTHQLLEIKKTIDFIATKSIEELNFMYNEMQAVLEHNYKKVLSLTNRDFEGLNVQ